MNLVPFCFWANFVVSVHCSKKIINFKVGKLSILDLKWKTSTINFRCQSVQSVFIILGIYNFVRKFVPECRLSFLPECSVTKGKSNPIKSHSITTWTRRARQVFSKKSNLGYYEQRILVCKMSTIVQSRGALGDQNWVKFSPRSC